MGGAAAAPRPGRHPLWAWLVPCALWGLTPAAASAAPDKPPVAAAPTPAPAAKPAAPAAAGATKASAPAGAGVTKASAPAAAGATAAGMVADPFASAEKPAAPAPPVAPKPPYEDLLKAATPIRDLATLIEPLYARCEDRDDVPRRQCETIRGALLERLRGRTFVALADMAPDISPYDATAKEIDLEVSGCLACKAPPLVSGQPRYLVTRPPRQEGGRVVSAALATHQIDAPTKVQADRFLERVAPRLQVQHIFRVGAPFGEPTTADKAQGRPGDAGKLGAVKSPAAKAPLPVKAEAEGAALLGVSIIPVAHRVYDRCTGTVTASSHPSLGPARVVADRSCPKRGSEELSQAELQQEAQRAALPERLSSRQVEEALQPVQERIHDCYTEYREVSGTAKVQLTLGTEGKLTNIVLAPPFDKAEIGMCLRVQIKSATFPRFRGDPMKIDYAFQVN